MKVAFLGLPLAACLLAGDGHEIVLAALSRPGVPGRRRLERLIGPARVLAKPRLDARFLVRLAEAAPDLIVSWFWTSKIPVEVVASAKLGAFGVHPSLLPRHRGPDPTTWAILAGDSVTGVTAHRIAADYDTGALLGARTLPIDPAWNAWQLARALDRPSLELLREVCRAFAAGTPPNDVPQDESQATEAPFLDEEQTIVRWARPTSEILRLIRALAPAPCAVTEVGGGPLLLLEARAADAPSILEQPGESIVDRGRVLVRTSDGALEIVAAERDGIRVSGAELAALFA